MISRSSGLFSTILTVALVIAGPVYSATATAAAIDDPDPNSPTPILLSHSGSLRVLAAAENGAKRVDPSRIEESAFASGSRVMLYVTNLALLPDEGSSAFRVYVRDVNGHLFRFPVTNLKPSKWVKGIYELTVELTDEIGYWPSPEAGDVAIFLTWRGLSSNQLLLGLNQRGGGVGKIDGAVPMPLDEAIARSNARNAGVSESPNVVGYQYAGDRIRFLEQATFGPTSAADFRLRRIGIKTWLAEQFDMAYPSAANAYPNIDLRPTNRTSDCDGQGGDDVPPTCYRDHYTMYPVQTWFYREALYGEPQLRHRVSWALNQIWVIASPDTQQSSHMLAYHQLLSANAFGNWRNLMQDMTLNPGMGNYLDMIRSTKNNPNENYPREILQLFNIGLFMLNQDGTLMLDGQNNPIPTYDQATVNNFTKVFTGWRDCRSTDFGASCPNSVPGSPDFKDPMSLATANHDLTAKTLLNYTGSTTSSIAACGNCTNATNIAAYANASLNQSLNNIFNHPNVAPFASKLLIQHLVTSDPTPAYVGRVAAVFNNNGFGVRGDLKAVIRAILIDPEARGDVKTDPTYGKLREPVQLVTNLYRQIGVTGANGVGLSDGHFNRYPNSVGQDAFRSPTVFNFYPPTYIVPGTSLLGPEFAIYNTGTAIGRANLNDTIVFGQINVALPDSPNGTKINFIELQAISAADPTSNQLMDVLNTRMMHGAMSPAMRSTIITAVNANTATSTLARVQAAVYLIVTSSQYQVQR